MRFSFSIFKVRGQLEKLLKGIQGSYSLGEQSSMAHTFRDLLLMHMASCRLVGCSFVSSDYIHKNLCGNIFEYLDYVKVKSLVPGIVRDEGWGGM